MRYFGLVQREMEVATSGDIVAVAGVEAELDGMMATAGLTGEDARQVVASLPLHAYATVELATLTDPL